MNFIKAELLILVPCLNGVGIVLKNRIKIPSNLIPWILILISIVFSTIYGFVVSTQTGWRMVLDGFVITGILHGVVAAFVSMGIYDTAKTRKTA